MHALLMTEEEPPRLYSKPARAPADVVAPRHAEIHELLDRWGSWQRERYSPETCASLEKLYYKGGRDTPPPSTAPMPPDPNLVMVDMVWRLMVRRVPQHAEAIRLYYVERMRPWNPSRNHPSICRLLVINWRNFDWFMDHARSMAKNILREIEG